MPGRQLFPLVQGTMEFEIQDADSFAEQFSRRFMPLKIQPVSAREKIGVRGVFSVVPGLEFSNMNFSGNFSMLPQASFDSFTFMFSHQGAITFGAGERAISGSQNIALAAESICYDSLVLSPGYASSALVIRRALMIERLAILLDRPIVVHPKFASMIDLDLDGLAALRSLLSFLTAAPFVDELNRTKLTGLRLREMLVDLVLETWPHTYSEALRRPPPLIAPRSVKLARDFINEHPHVHATGTELAALTGVSLRSLQVGFRRFIGSSISTYQRQVRLERARDDLARNPESAIDEVALRWGFTNTSRFSRYFKGAFGVSPRDITRRR